MKDTVKKSLYVIGDAMIATLTGFGLFWYMVLIGGKVFVAIFLGMIISAVMMEILNPGR